MNVHQKTVEAAVAQQDLDLAVVGNGRTVALVNPLARIVWWCFPRYDGDPVFCRLIAGEEEKGFADVVLDGRVSSASAYLRNTAIVETVLTDKDGGAVRITDFAPLVDPRWPDDGLGFGHNFQLPVADFALHSANLDAYRTPGRSAGSCVTGTAGLPYLVLCASGEVAVDVAGTVVELGPGRAAFVPAREALFTLTGTGETFLATVGELGAPAR